DRARMARLDERAYLRVIGCLQEVAGVVILDCGTGLQEPPARAALATAEQVVLVTDAEPATASIVAEAARSLTPSKRVLLVVNKVPAMGLRLDLEAFARLVPGAQGLVTIPSDVRAASRLAAGEFGWGTAPSGWRIAAAELAAMLVAGWRELGLTLTQPPAPPTPRPFHLFPAPPPPYRYTRWRKEGGGGRAMSPKPKPGRGGGSAGARGAGLGAPGARLLEPGFGTLGGGAGARRAGVHKTPVYRRWPDRERLL